MPVFSKTCLLGLCVGLGWSCSSAVPTDVPGVSAVGDHVRRAAGAELEVVLGSRYAAGHLGDEVLILGVSLSGADGGKAVKVDRESITVQTPDRRRLPLMSQDGFRAGYGRLAAAARQAEFSSPTALDSRPSRRPCDDWFFRAPSDGLARNVLFISSIEVCEGLLFFDVPGGVQPGRWELEIALEESDVEIPFVLD
jgi:hypothetical protein